MITFRERAEAQFQSIVADLSREVAYHMRHMNEAQLTIFAMAAERDSWIDARAKYLETLETSDA